MTKTILITGAGSGFGKGRRHRHGEERPQHHRRARRSPRRSRRCARRPPPLGLKNFRVERLDLTDPYDIKQAQRLGLSTCSGTMPAWARPARSGKSRSSSCARTTRSTSSCRSR